MPENDSFDPQMFLPYLLNQAAEECSLDFQRHYKERYGILRTEWRVLFHLGIYGRMSAGDIGRKARMHKTKISRAVQRLADRRFLTRIPDASDRRVEQLELTRAGRAVLDDAAPLWDAMQIAVIDRFGRRAWRELVADLERLQACIPEADEETR
jgi:DNA-binding MarR family transcriptional regulator